ncbi:hypothetical protein D1AOALGA4SA_1092 [Olavius algarvensis Delta 1 endosymbiont]|nr:hypothetical protein D1AOALGA4SA_1092 [Olavius algarvensis Delta 1 endosymbiont]
MSESQKAIIAGLGQFPSADNPYQCSETLFVAAEFIHAW